MKIIADENIIFVNAAFSEFGDVHLYHGREITSTLLKDADALLVRSITEVNANLLAGTNVKLLEQPQSAPIILIMNTLLIKEFVLSMPAVVILMLLQNMFLLLY